MGGLALASPWLKSLNLSPFGIWESSTFRSARAEVAAAFSGVLLRPSGTGEPEQPSWCFSSYGLSKEFGLLKQA